MAKQGGLSFTDLICYYKMSMPRSNRSSQSSPTVKQQAGRDYRRPTLKIRQDKGTLTIQTEELAIQAIFNSPILQVADYIQQFEKYNLRAALSGLNLKVDDYDKHYTTIKDKIEELHSTLMYKTLSMIQDLLVSMRLAKIEMWRSQAAIAYGMKTHLFQKILDPYDFNPSQFQPDIASACEMLKNPANQQEKISELSLKLKQFQAMKMEEMFSGKVCHPFLAQNKDHQELNTSSLYNSLLNQLKFKMEKSDESIFKRHYSIQEEIIKFMQASTEHNLKAQKIAHSLIKKYNEYQSQGNQFLIHSITPIIEIAEKRQTIDADELYTNKQYRSDLRPAFANRSQTIEFKKVSKMFDPQTGIETEVQCLSQEENLREWDRYGGLQAHNSKTSPFQVFSQRRRNNPKEFYQLREFQKQKYRQQQARMRERQRNQRERQRQRDRIVSKKIIRAMPIPPPWVDFAQQENPFIYFYFMSNQKEFNMWDIKQKASERDYSNYNCRKERNANPPLFRTVQEKNNFQLQAKKAELALQQKEQAAINFQIRRREEESYRLARVHKLIESRTYEKFMAMNKLEMRNPPFCDTHAVSRYGITFNVNFQRSKQPKQIDRFFYLYFKERYYQENESIKENADNPIIFLDSSKINMDGPPKIVSQYINSIIKRAESLSFFLVWGEDLLHYRLKTSRDSKTAYFEFYAFATPSNSQKLMYQLRRRLTFEVKEQIKDSYCGAKEIQRIYSKVEVAHRLIFDRHKEMPDLAESILKGKQLVSEIFDSLRN